MAEEGSQFQKVVKLVQSAAAPQKKSVWNNRGAVCSEGLWRSPDGRLVLQASMKPSIFEEAHGLAHLGYRQMKRNLCFWWYPYMTHWIKQDLHESEVCGQFNPKPTINPGFC